MRNAYLPNDNLILAIIRRIDLDCDAQLNPGEFIDAVRPNEDVPVQSRSRSRPRSAIKPNSNISGNQGLKPRSISASRGRSAQPIKRKAIETKPENPRKTQTHFIEDGRKSNVSATPTKNEYLNDRTLFDQSW